MSLFYLYGFARKSDYTLYIQLRRAYGIRLKRYTVKTLRTAKGICEPVDKYSIFIFYRILIEPPDIVVLVQANETMTYAARTTITMSITVLHILSRNVFS